MSEPRLWAIFGILGLAWGTSFLFIKIGVETLEPLTLVSGRLLIGLLGLLAIISFRRLPLPRDRATWGHLIFMGLFNTAVPFVLFTWGESGPNGVDSGVAAILNSMVPLFSIVLAGLVLRTEPFTAGRIVGLIVGFAGVLLLFGRNLGGENGDLLHHLAPATAALLYALCASYVRRYLQHLNPIVLAAGQLLWATVFVVVAALVLEDLAAQSFPPRTIFALVWLGLLGSCLAYIFFFILLQHWGATRTTLVTYVIPVVGVTAGAIFLNETVDWRLLVGGGLILSGVAAVNWPGRRRIAPQAAD